MLPSSALHSSTVQHLLELVIFFFRGEYLLEIMFKCKYSMSGR